MVHFDPLILGWVSATQRTLSGQSSYLFDNLKRKMVVAATTTKTRCLYYSRLSVVCRYVREFFKQKHKRQLATAVQPTIVARYTLLQKGIMEMVRVAEAHTKSYVIIFYRLYS